MSSYWKKKLDELEQNNTSSTQKSTKQTTATGGYWGNKLTELEKEEQKKKEAEKDIAPVAGESSYKTIFSPNGGTAQISNEAYYGAFGVDYEDEAKQKQQKEKEYKKAVGFVDRNAYAAYDFEGYSNALYKQEKSDKELLDKAREAAEERYKKIYGEPNGTDKLSSDVQIFKFYKEEVQKDRETYLAYLRQDYRAAENKVEEIERQQRENEQWFKAGAFDDGYQFGDVTKTILGTAGDAVVGIGKGFTRGVEGVVDLAAYGVAEVGNWFGGDTDWVKERAKESQTDEIFGGVSADADENSILGNKGDAIPEAVGNIILIAGTGGAAGALGAGAAATTAVTTGLTFASGMGGGMSEAYQAGATDGEAWGYGAMAGTAEAATELLFGGLGKGTKAIGVSKGIGGLDDILAKGASSKFKSRLAKNLVEMGVKAGGEGSEEVIAGWLQAHAKKMTFESEKDWAEILEDEELLDQFIIGAISSGLSQSGDVVKSTKNDTDFVTGLTANEEAVLDKLYQNEITKAEENGEKLSAIDKNKIYDDLSEQMAKGYISTDDIESVLGGDTYTKYKELTDSEDALQKEYDTLKSGYDVLEQMEWADESQKTKLRQQLEAVEQKLNDIKNNPQKRQLQAQLDKEVYDLTANDPKLRESFYEKVRGKQKFTADVTKYKGKAREIIQGVIDKGHTNNTRKMHEFWDWAANVAAERNLNITSTTTEEIVEMVTKKYGAEYAKKAFEGVTPNAYYLDDGTIAINMKSFEGRRFLVGHEVTHSLENAKHYGDLRELLYAYAENSIGTEAFNARKQAIANKYKNVKGADPDAELTADLVGELLYSDENFVRHLSTKNRNVFQKIWDEIKYLYKMATAGSQEARELEKIKRVFENVYKESTKTQSKSDTKGNEFYDSAEKFSLRVTDKDTLEFLDNQDTITTYKTMQLVDGKLYPPMAARTEGKYEDYSELGVWEQATEHPELIKNGNKFKLDKGKGQGSIEAAYNPYMHSSNLVLNDQFSGAYKRDNLVTVECEVPVSELTSGYHAEHAKDSVGWHPWHTGTVAGQLRNAKGTERQVFLSRWIKPVRIVPDSEVATMYKELLDGTAVEVPDNVVTPSLLRELKNAGVKIKESGRIQFSLSDSDGNPIDTERISSDELDIKYSISHNEEIAKGQSNYVNDHKAYVTSDELEEAQKVTAAMVDVMMKYSSILPEDKIGKVLTKNGSYDRSVENTTICVRTLAYNEFVDKVQEEIGRPLTQMESFLVSQKMYDIATDPQCLYCYVSLDRKAFNDMLLRYMQDRDTVIAKYNNSDKTDATIEQLYEEFLHGRKPTTEMRKRFDSWLSYVDSGTQLLSLADIATEERQSTIKADGGILAEQLADARKYAQSASWSKIQKDYVAYRDEILKLGDKVVKNLNEHYGMRWYSFSDYSAAFIVENMQQITDASIRGLKGLSYTKDTDYAEIFAPSGMNINVSVFVNADANGNFFIDEKQSANFEKALALREQYPNVGIVATVTNDEALRWVAEQEWSDVIIPFHIVRTGADVAEYYKWLNYTAESADTIGDKDMWNAYLDSLNLSDSARKRVSKNIYPSEHKNDKATYLNLCESRGLTPRFARFAGEEWYMKLVNETRLSADESSPLKPVYNLEAAKESFAKFVEKGGYEGGWYKDGTDVDAEAKAVAADVLAGKKANEVDYGRQDGFVPEDLIAGRKSNRQHGRYSLSLNGEAPIPYGRNDGAMAEGYYNPQEIAPVVETVAKTATVDNTVPDGFAPISEEEAEALRKDSFANIDDADMPPEVSRTTDRLADAVTIDNKSLKQLSKNIGDSLGLNRAARAELERVMQEFSQDQYATKETLLSEIQRRFGTQYSEIRADEVAEAKDYVRNTKIYVSPTVKSEFGDAKDYVNFMRRNFGKIRFSQDGTGVDQVYLEASEMYPSLFPADIINPADQLNRIAEIANTPSTELVPTELPDDVIMDATDMVYDSITEYRETERMIGLEEMAGVANEHLDDFAPVVGTAENSATDKSAAPVVKETAPVETKKSRRQELHESIIENIKSFFKGKGFDFDKVLKNAKDLSTFATVDNTPQRVMEKALGYKEGQALSDLTVNQVAQNETEGIKWLNSFTDRRNGLLAQISKQYNIKAGSKESAAAQMYAEGFYVDKNNDIVQYGDAELAKDFPNAKVQANIKGLAKDPRIRQIYDDTLAMINESRTRNAYPEIPRLDNYFLHFRAMEDTFSRLGLPFNPNDIRAKDLPTDLNGVTADLKPGQPFFASAMHRTGKRTSFDLLGGLERYLSSAKNQIYHIDDIQTLRALRNYIADTYGQAKGLEGLDALSEEEVQERIEKVYNSHLSTFAKFLNEEANVLAGKTTLIDRGLEGIIGRRGITFLDTINKQVGSNMVGMNVSSSLTNILPVVQTFAKTNKFDFVKGFAQTVSNKLGSIIGKTDGFAENSPVVIRRKGAERFYRTPWQKVGDAGYVLMSAVDEISTEIIARTKYNELTRKGMDSQTAHFETDKWVSRLMGDRSLGQQPQVFNSKMLGMFTKFQLEVRNQLDSQFYDTVQEAKVSNEDIQNGLARNAKIAAKVTSTFFQLAVAQHVFGKVFESIAGYNPAFDIISVLATALGFDDEEDSEDTELDNIEQAFLELLEDLPYTSTFTGGRIPISSALPIEELVTGVDQYGNEKSRWETIKEIAPYYVLPTGYGQIKKTHQGLSMFDEDLPIAGSYTDSGNLRFPVEDTPENRLQAGLFGQWASENARDYFDNDWAPLKEKQIEEFVDLDLPIAEYHEIREGLSECDTLAEKADYINSLDLPTDKKNILINNIADRKEDIDMEDYGEYGSFEEFDYAEKNPEKYQFFKDNGISYSDYSSADEDTKRAYSWAYENPEKYTVSKAICDDFLTYYHYKQELYDIKADKDGNGDTIIGSGKEKKLDYINSLDLDYGQKIILFRSLYDSKEDKETYNADIVDYLNSRDDISYEEMVTILKELGFTVSSDGYVTW